MNCDRSELKEAEVNIVNLTGHNLAQGHIVDENADVFGPLSPLAPFFALNSIAFTQATCIKPFTI